MISLSRRIAIASMLLTVLVVGLAAIVVWGAYRWRSLVGLDDELRGYIEAQRMHLEGPPPMMALPMLLFDDAPPEPPPLPEALAMDGGWVYIESPHFLSPSLDGRELDLPALLSTRSGDGMHWIADSRGQLRACRVTGADGETLYAAIAADALLAEWRAMGWLLFAIFIRL